MRFMKQSTAGLFCGGAAQMLYLEGEGSFEFERTASRLREMQAADWAQMSMILGAKRANLNFA